MQAISGLSRSTGSALYPGDLITMCSAHCYEHIGTAIDEGVLYDITRLVLDLFQSAPTAGSSSKLALVSERLAFHSMRMRAACPSSSAITREQSGDGAT
jgi:hypothetical protein